MIGIVFASVLTLIIMGVSFFFGFFPNGEGASFFFIGILVIGRIKTSIYKSYFRNIMDGALKVSQQRLHFSDEEVTLLKSTSGIIIPPQIYITEFARTEPASLNFYLQILCIIFGGVSLFFSKYYSAVVALAVMFTGTRLWQASFFYVGDERMNILNAISLYVKEIGQSPKAFSEGDWEQLGMFFVRTRDKLVTTMASLNSTEELPHNAQDDD